MICQARKIILTLPNFFILHLRGSVKASRSLPQSDLIYCILDTCWSTLAEQRVNTNNGVIIVKNKILRHAALSAVMIAAVSGNVMAESGSALYQNLCGICHVPTGQPTAAPPVFAVKNHVIRIYPKREDFVNYVVSWVAAPNAARALMPGAVRKFGVMPAMPYAADEVKQVAEFIYDSNVRLPSWYKEHYEAEHGIAPAE